MGIDAILEESRVAKRTLYNHFRSKDESSLKPKERLLLLLEGAVTLAEINCSSVSARQAKKAAKVLKGK